MPEIRTQREKSVESDFSHRATRVYTNQNSALSKEECRWFNVNHSLVQRWYTKFWKGRTSIENHSPLPTNLVNDKRGAIATDWVLEFWKGTNEVYGWERLRHQFIALIWAHLTSTSSPSWGNLFVSDTFGCSKRTGRWKESKQGRGYIEGL